MLRNLRDEVFFDADRLSKPISKANMKNTSVEAHKNCKSAPEESIACISMTAANLNYLGAKVQEHSDDRGYQASVH